MEPHCPLQVLNIRSSLPHLRVIVLYGDEEVPAEVTKQYHMSPEPFELELSICNDVLCMERMQTQNVR